ncbi:MAG: hypothetical protein DRJ38_04030 [Thermoprotei archaeon]|nr:MAG: hypothetical protein DRJ38_04030 [Thermoprotei archaeon]
MRYWTRFAGTFFTVLGALLLLNITAPAVLSVPPDNAESFNLFVDPVWYFNLLVGPGEELMFRLVLPLGFMRILGVGFLPASIISNVIFGLLHGPRSNWDAGVMGFTASAGVIISLTVYFFSKQGEILDLRGSLLGATLAHALYDLLIFVLTDDAKIILAITFLALGFMSWRRLRFYHA